MEMMVYLEQVVEEAVAWETYRHGGNGGGGTVVVRYEITQTQTGTAKATGGSISYYGGKTIHTFTNSGQFTTTTAIPSAEVFIVAGGGSGGTGSSKSGSSRAGGGGGAGGVVFHPGLAFPSPSPIPLQSEAEGQLRAVG